MNCAKCDKEIIEIGNGLNGLIANLENQTEEFFEIYPELEGLKDIAICLKCWERTVGIQDKESKLYKLLYRRAISPEVSKFFNERGVKKTGYYWYSGPFGLDISNNPATRRKIKGSIDTYLYKDVLANMDRFFNKELVDWHLFKILEIIDRSEDKQVDDEIDKYLMENNKYLK
jgi:hypothetical protein